MSKDTVITVAKDQDQAERILTALHKVEIPIDKISVLMSESMGENYLSTEVKTKAPEGAAAGGTVGAVAGGIIGALAGIGALAIPGLGALVAAGPILGALSGAGVGATSGGLVGWLTGCGFTEIEAKQYEDSLKEGNILISVHSEVERERDAARKIFKLVDTEGVGALDSKEG